MNRFREIGDGLFVTAKRSACVPIEAIVQIVQVAYVAGRQCTLGTTFGSREQNVLSFSSDGNFRFPPTDRR
jgi:hypothetical protein